jgi:hypothetical protein
VRVLAVQQVLALFPVQARLPVQVLVLAVQQVQVLRQVQALAVQPVQGLGTRPIAIVRCVLPELGTALEAVQLPVLVQ